MVATDGSHYAELSAKYAAQLYSLMPEKPEVWLVYVLSDPEGVGPKGLEMEIRQAKSMLTTAAARFENYGNPDADIHILVELGDTRRKLVEILKKLQIEHLFMGGADFSTIAADIASGGISNYMLHHLDGMVTIIK